MVLYQNKSKESATIAGVPLDAMAQSDVLLDILDCRRITRTCAGWRTEPGRRSVTATRLMWWPRECHINLHTYSLSFQLQLISPTISALFSARSLFAVTAASLVPPCVGRATTICHA